MRCVSVVCARSSSRDISTDGPNVSVVRFCSLFTIAAADPSVDNRNV